MRDRFLSLPLALTLFLCIGCGSGTDYPDLGKVSGAIKMDGNPLAGVTVTFAPTDGRPSSGVTDASGKYELTYAHDTKGAQVGEHTVHIISQGGPEGGGNPNEERGGDAAADVFMGVIPTKYNEESTLTASVKAGSNTFDFDLESK